MSGNEKTPYENITSLEELIVQFGYLRIHMDDGKFLDIIKKVTEIINVYKQKNLWENYNQDIVLDKKSRSNAVNQGLHELSFKLTMNLFEIARILNNDIYGAGKSDTNTLTSPITTQIQELLSIAFQVKEIDSLES